MPSEASVRFAFDEGVPDVERAAQIVGNLIAFRLQGRRTETLDWTLCGGSTPTGRPLFRLEVFPTKVGLNLGLRSDFAEILRTIAIESLRDLETEYAEDIARGFAPVDVEDCLDAADYWQTEDLPTVFSFAWIGYTSH